MNRYLHALLGALVLACVFASSAQAAVTLGFAEAKHKEATIYRGDGVVTYTIKLKNEGDSATAGSTSVAVALPSGVEFATGSGSGWTCLTSTQTCTSSAVVAAGAQFLPLEIQAWIYPELAADTIVANFTASGGGAGSNAVTSDSVTMAPEKPFELEGFGAGACTEPPVGGGSGICSSIFASSDYTQAGGHPFAATSRLAVPTRTSAQKGQAELAPVQSLRDLYFELPAGFIGNPEAVGPACTVSQIQTNPPTCPESAVVGGVGIDVSDSKNQERAIYRMIPEEGYAAAFAFRPLSLSPVTYALRVKLRTNGDYGVTAVAPLPPQLPEFIKLHYTTLCSYGAQVINEGTEGLRFIRCKTPDEAGANEIPLLSNPTRCDGNTPITRAHIDSYEHPAATNAEGFPDLSDPYWKSSEAVAPATTDCAPLTEAWVGSGPVPTKPTFGFQPDSDAAASPAAYTANLHIPQDGLFDPDGLATAHLKDTKVILPAGISLNPSAANGLGVCTTEQAGLIGTNFPAPNPIRFSTISEGCPLNSKIGTVQVITPVLAEPLDGAVYLAAQDANPFGSRFAIYLVIDDKKTGVKATLAGRVSPSSVDGQVTTTFTNNPQVPLEALELKFFGGPRASLANPDVCGDYTVRTELTPWSAADPDNPLPSEIAVSEDTVSIDSAPAGGACPTTKAGRPFNPTFSAGSVNPVAGAHSPFVLRITRPDGAQELDKISVATPPGFAATLKGVATCPAAAVEAAQAPGRSGKAELNSPSCPASSQIGTTMIGAGVGSNPFYVDTGKIYLTGPYKSAPVSLTFIVPAVAGPFDLGVQVVKTALNVDPKTAQITAVSDPIPQILDGIPLQIRDVRVALDRPGFTFNPTNCAAMAINAQVQGGSGAVANLDNRFQVGGCRNLGFKPSLKLQLHGGTKRGAYQRMVATLTARPGDANIARAAVTLPHSAFLAQEHIATICTRVQFAARICPKASVYGFAKATTPLLDEPLSGPVYLRSNPDQELPDLVAALRGPDSMPIEVELSGRTDSKNEGIRNTFDIVPDAPVSTFVLQLKGGKKSLIVNSRDLCKGTQRATVRMTGQNGKLRNFRTIVRNDCKSKKANKR